MNELKLLRQDDTIAVIGGYGVIFGGEDLEGERFTAKTDFMLDLVPVKPVYVDHSEGSVIEANGKQYKLAGIDRAVGHVVSVTPDDVGLYMELQFEKANRYWRHVFFCHVTLHYGDCGFRRRARSGCAIVCGCTGRLCD